MSERVRNTALFRLLRKSVHPWRQRRHLWVWVEEGLPLPPPHFVKEAVLRSYARRFNTTVFVETGTYMGEMVQAMRGDFAAIYSIELSRGLFEKASLRFSGDPRITLINGDSKDALKSVLPLLEEPTLFWLDGHWSGGVTALGTEETPIRDEIAQILAAPDLGHAILIDDARCFGTEAAYPTVEALRHQVLSRRPHLSFTVDLDIIRIVPTGGK